MIDPWASMSRDLLSGVTLLKTFGSAYASRLVIIITFLALGGMAALSSLYDYDWPTIQITATPDAKEISAIEAVLEHSYDVNAKAEVDFDVSEYPGVYMDDPSVPTNAEQAQYVEQVRNTRGSAVSGLLHDGYLSFKLAQILDSEQAVEGLERIEATAKAENRPITPVDLKSVSGVSRVPYRRGNVIQKKPGEPSHFVYNDVSIDVSSTRAEVTYDDGSALAEAFLVKTPSGWKVAGIRAIKVHF
jgi:hypothetical protein